MYEHNTRECCHDTNKDVDIDENSYIESFMKIYGRR